MKKLYTFILCMGMTMPCLAQQNFEVGKPNNINYRYLDDYADLK